MKTKRYKVLYIALLTYLLMCTEQAIGMASPRFVKDRDVLHRVQGVRILIGDMSDVEQKHGLTKEALQTDVELRLRQSGIPILGIITLGSEKGKTEETNAGVTLPENSPALLISIDTVFDETEMSAVVFINVILYETVSLLGRPGLEKNPHCMAATWSESSMGRFGNIRFSQSVRETVRDKVDKFCNEYLAANPSIKESYQTVKISPLDTPEEWKKIKVFNSNEEMDRILRESGSKTPEKSDTEKYKALFSDSGNFKVRVYNKSSYNLKEITIAITAKNKNGDILWSKQFKQDIFLRPQGYLIFEEEIEIKKLRLEYLNIPENADLSWTVDEFRGTPIIK